MFLTYINELIGILEEFSITVKLFADDVKMYLKIIHDVDVVQLQAAVTVHRRRPSFSGRRCSCLEQSA